MTDLPDGWSLVTLNEAMAECKNGLTYRNNPELAGFPVSRIETISKGEIDFEKVGYGGVSLDGNQKHLLNPGDILFSHINSMLHVGKVAIYRSGMPALLHGMNLLRITPNDAFMPEFLFYLFQSSDVRKQIWSKAKHAVNQASINIGELKTVVIPKPPVDEQHKIVELLEDHLSRLDAALNDVKQAKIKAAQFRRSLLQSAFTGNLTGDGTSLMADLPNGWEQKRMGDIGRYLNGKAFKSKDWKTSGRPIIRIQNLTGSGDAYNYFQGEIEERYLVKPGDLLFSWSATLGTYIWQGPEAVLNQHIFKVESFIDKKFHRYLMDFKIQEMLSKTHGSGMVHITKKSFDAIEVYIPPLPEQQKIVEILEDHLSRLEASVAIADAMEKQSASLRRSLLQAAFTGKLTKEVSSV